MGCLPETESVPAVVLLQSLGRYLAGDGRAHFLEVTRDVPLFAQMLAKRVSPGHPGIG